MTLAELLGQVQAMLAANEFWRSYLSGLSASASVHIAWLVQPYLTYILTGRKRRESRFRRRARLAPFGKVAEGDVLLLMQSGVGIVGIALVGEVEDITLDEAGWVAVRGHQSELCVSDSFMDGVADAKYATIIELLHVSRLEQVVANPWRSRLGWLVLKSEARATDD